MVILAPWIIGGIAATVLYWVIRSAVRAGIREGMKDHELWRDR
jgi:hypothetical protein